MENIDEMILDENADINQRYHIFLKSIQSLNSLENKSSYKKYIDELLPFIGTIIQSYTNSQTLPKNTTLEYVRKYQELFQELLKYQVWLIGEFQICCTVKILLDPAKVHICGNSSNSCIKEDIDYIIICGKIDADEFKKIEDNYKDQLIRYDFLRFCGYLISPETKYLDIILKNKIEEGAEGAVTGLSYVQRGINYDKIQRNIVCLAAPSQDLYLDFQNFKWLYHEAAVKRKGTVKYCIIGMSFYSLWYDLSLSGSRQFRMLCFYNRLKCIHHFSQAADLLIKSEEDLAVCEEIMVKNYMDLDFQKNFHPESRQWIRTTEYDSSGEVYIKDSEKVKNIFHKPYPLTFQENISILEKYLKFLSLHEIKTMIYIPPFPKVFNDFTPSDMRQATYDVLTRLQEKYKFDIFDLSIHEQFTDKYFADWNHLNGNGADLATEMLNEHMDHIWK